MQIRELDLKELDIVYELLSSLYKELSYKEFEDLIYDMRHMEYKMIGILDGENLISYAGVVIQTTFKDKRHLRVFELISSKKYDRVKYDKMMKDYLDDYSRMAMCSRVVF
ncbi:MAG: GNAT family N-acetyltransferase [Campylobacterota bacterium]|nr:GNAT family N-acetyltransferase [Campylobacterota bacterium]